MKKKLCLIAALVMVMVMTSGVFTQSTFAKSYKRYEFYGSNVSSVKVKGKKIIIKGKAILTHKLDSGTDSKLKTLKNKKRTYKMTSKTKFYLLHWTDATKISKKKALSSIKHMSYYMGFQVKVKGKKIDKLYILNHGS